MSLKSRLSAIPEWLPTLLVGVAIGILWSTSQLTVPPTSEVNTEWLGVAVDGLLTIALLGVYYRTMRIQEAQTELTELERAPHVEISGYSPGKNRLTVYLSNYGSGAVTNLELATVSYFESDSDALEPGEGSTSLERVIPEADHSYDRSLPPHTQRERFEVSPVLPVYEQADGGGFLSGLDTLRASGVNEVAFQLHVRYDTRTGDRRSIPIFDLPRQADTEQADTFEDAYLLDQGVTQVPSDLPDKFPQPEYLPENPGHHPRKDELRTTSESRN